MLKSLIKITKQKLILPFYHTVSNRELPHIRHLYQVRNVKQFTKDLDFFLKHYKPIDLHELKDIISNNKTIKENIFHLSFDDGLRECHEIIAPILKQKGIPATFFLNSNFIDNKKLFYKFKISLIVDKIDTINKKNNVFNKSLLDNITSTNYSTKNILNKLAKTLELDFNTFLQTNKPYLTTPQIRSLISDGFTIGSHSIDHPEYRFISEKEQIRQTKNSIDFICNKFNLNYKIFAFPFTDFGVKKIFFETLFNNKFAELTFGTAGLKKDEIKQNLQRIPIEVSNKTALYTVKYQYFYYLIKSFLNKNIILRK